jgi:trans-aconitate methyltransferase
MSTTEQEFRKSSTDFNSSLSHELRLKEGIFFTPKKARDILYETLDKLAVSPTSILEPSFGSGEFLLDMHRKYPKAKLTGVEKNEALYNSLKHPKITTVQSDFLEWNPKDQFDLIVGNPPYFTVSTEGLSQSEKKAFAKKHANCMTGRPNMYILFLYKCLTQHLKANGYLAFIIPTSLYNCSYYQPMRDYIAQMEVCHVETLNKPGFFETGQETMLLVIKKAAASTNFLYKAKNGLTYITPYYKELELLTANTTTIQGMGLLAKTGNVVWNQVKSNLSDEGTLLIYASNINNSTLQLNNIQGAKKQYVKDLTKPTLSGPVILVERGYGNTFKFNTALVDMKNFYAENHLNVIYAENMTPALTLQNLQKILTSFKDPRTMLFVKWFIGNGMLSASELTTILPIFEPNSKLEQFVSYVKQLSPEEKKEVENLL